MKFRFRVARLLERVMPDDMLRFLAKGWLGRQQRADVWVQVGRPIVATTSNGRRYNLTAGDELHVAMANDRASSVTLATPEWEAPCS